MFFSVLVICTKISTRSINLGYILIVSYKVLMLFQCVLTQHLWRWVGPIGDRANNIT